MIEKQIAAGTDGTFEQAKPDDSVTNQRKFIDPHGDGKEREATTVSPTAGASSDAPPESGIPSAVKQQGNRAEATAPQDKTTLGDASLESRPRSEP